MVGWRRVDARSLGPPPWPQPAGGRRRTSDMGIGGSGPGRQRSRVSDGRGGLAVGVPNDRGLLRESRSLADAYAGGAALRLGELTSPEDDVSAPVRRMGRFSPFTHLANLTGLPAMSVPLHWNSEGIPIGLHFMGAMGAEGTLFRLAGQLEQACPWVGRLPPVHA